MAKSTYQQHRKGRIVWVHNKIQPHHTPAQHQGVWEGWVDQVAAGTSGMKDAAVIGELAPEVVGWLAKHNQAAPATGDIVATREKVQHILSSLKASRGAGVGLAATKALPTHLAAPKAVLWDSEDPALVCVFDANGPFRGKFVSHR